MLTRVSVAVAVALLGVSAAAYADDDDMRVLLDGNRGQQQQYRQSDWLDDNAAAQQEDDDEAHSIVLGGQTYRIAHNRDDLGLAVYHAANSRQWQKLRALLAAYRSLPDAAPEVVLLAEGLLAREDGDYDAAIARLQDAFAAEPHNPRVQLELARAYTEDNRNKEAARQFRQILELELPQETRAIVESYIGNIEKRSDWHGSFSVGFGHNDNINQANGFKQCVFQLVDQCLIEQELPHAVGSNFQTYQAAASKKIPLKNNHSLMVRALSYGTHYRKQDEQSTYLPDLSDHTAQIYAGYDYSDARNNVSVLPYWEHYYRGDHTDYTALGIDMAASRKITPKFSLDARANSKRYHYTEQGKQIADDYTQSTLGLGWLYQFSPTWVTYGGLDFGRKNYASPYASSKDITARVGVFKQFQSGIYANILGLYRDSRYDEKPYYLSEKRHDKQKILIASLGMPRFAWHGITPELRFKRTIADSNGVFFNYKQSETSLNLKYSF